MNSRFFSVLSGLTLLVMALVLLRGEFFMGGSTMPQNWYNVQSFGAMGDGTTDDRTAIQSAINTAESNGTEVFFPEGVYRITGPLIIDNDAVTLRGVGVDDGGGAPAAGSAIRFDFAAAALGSSGIYVGFDTSRQVSNVCFRDMGFYSKNQALGSYNSRMGHLIHLQGVNRCMIERCLLYDAWTKADTGYAALYVDAGDTTINTDGVVIRATDIYCNSQGSGYPGHGLIVGCSADSNTHNNGLVAQALRIFDSQDSMCALHIKKGTGAGLECNQHSFYGGYSDTLGKVIVETNYNEFHGFHINGHPDSLMLEFGANARGNIYSGSLLGTYHDLQETGIYRAVFTITGGAIPMQSMAHGFYDVTSFGAVPGDGIYDTDAFQDGVNLANANGGGVLYVPPGLFEFDGPCTMKSNVHVSGNNRNSTVLKTCVNAPLFVNDPTDSLRNWEISNLSIKGTATSPSDSSNQHGIYFYLQWTDDWHDASFWSINNVSLWYLGGNGIWLRTDAETCDGSWNCQYFNEGWIEKVIAKKLYGHALLLQGNNIDLHFTDCYFENSKDSTNATFQIKIDNDTTGGAPDTVIYCPAVCIVDSCYNDEPAQWAEGQGIRFTRCALQTVYHNTSLTPDKVGACVYTRNAKGPLTFRDCWFEVDATDVPYRAIYSDSARCTFLTRASLVIDGCRFSGFAHTPEIVNLDIEWDAIVIGANEWLTCDGRYIWMPNYEPNEKLEYPGFMYFDVSESTFIFWNGARWDTLAHD